MLRTLIHKYLMLLNIRNIMVILIVKYQHDRSSDGTLIYTRPISRLAFYKTKYKTKKGNTSRLWSFGTKIEDGKSIKGINLIPLQNMFSKKNMYLYLWSPPRGGRKLWSSTYHWVYWSPGKSHIIVGQHFSQHWTLGHTYYEQTQEENENFLCEAQMWNFFFLQLLTLFDETPPRWCSDSNNTF